MYDVKQKTPLNCFQQIKYFLKKEKPSKNLNILTEDKSKIKFF